MNKERDMEWNVIIIGGKYTNFRMRNVKTCNYRHRYKGG